MMRIRNFRYHSIPDIDSSLRKETPGPIELNYLQKHNISQNITFAKLESSDATSPDCDSFPPCFICISLQLYIKPYISADVMKPYRNNLFLYTINVILMFYLIPVEMRIGSNLKQSLR